MDPEVAQVRFLIGEAHFALGDFKTAAAAYSDVRNQYPRSAWAPDAFYKLGRCFEALGLHDSAKVTYRRVTKRHRGHRVAAEAAERLRALGR